MNRRFDDRKGASNIQVANGHPFWGDCSCGQDLHPLPREGGGRGTVDVYAVHAGLSDVNLANPERRILLFGLGLAAIMMARFYVAAVTPLSADEAYYWLWSKHLAGGYYDHPPAIAFIVRIGTEFFGNTSLGVRFVP